jgi:hypothetical protein
MPSLKALLRGNNWPDEPVGGRLALCVLWVLAL